MHWLRPSSITRVVALLLVAAGSVAAQTGGAPAAAGVADADLIGLWGGDTLFGPRLRDSITIVPTPEGGWIAHIGGLEVPDTRMGNRWRFVLPDHEGELDVPDPRVGRLLHGFWMQPSGSRGRYATPVAFQLIWSPYPVLKGMVAPLDDRLSFWLSVQPGDSGTLRGVIRSPDAGWTGGRPWFRVARRGDTIELSDPATGQLETRPLPGVVRGRSGDRASAAVARRHRIRRAHARAA